MAQLVERSLPTPVANVIYYQLYSKDENKEKEAGSDPFINTLMLNFLMSSTTFILIFNLASVTSV